MKNVRSIKFSLDAVVSGLCFKLMLSMKEQATTEREIISRNIYSKTHKFSNPRSFSLGNP